MKKRMLALLAVLCCVALVAALFVACNNGEKGQSVDNNTGVTTPGDDDAQQGGETPDDEGQGGETPDDEQGGETQDPADPDEGEENPDEDINEPETPDEDIEGPETPGEDEGLVPPTTIDDLFPDNTDNGMTDEEFAEALKDANEYKKIIIDNLNANLYETIIKKAYSKVDFNLIDKDEAKWSIDVDESDPSKIAKIAISFIYRLSETSTIIYVESVVPEIDMYLSDLFDTEYDGYDAAFDTSEFGAKFKRELVFEYDPSIQGKYASLAKALNDASGKSGESSYIVPRGYSDNDIFGEVTYFKVFNMEENGYNTASYVIKGTSASSLEDLIESIQKGNFYSYDNESKTFSGHQITVVEIGQ